MIPREVPDVRVTDERTAVPLAGTWFGRMGLAPYQLMSGLTHDDALQMATHWATDGLAEASVEVEVELFAEGEEWVVDVVAHERGFPFETLGTRRARIDRSGRLVA